MNSYTVILGDFWYFILFRTLNPTLRPLKTKLKPQNQKKFFLDSIEARSHVEARIRALH